MTREVKIGSAVAGSFLSLVGIVVGTKMYNGDVPKVPDVMVAQAGDAKKDGDGSGSPPTIPAPGTLPSTFLSQEPLQPTAGFSSSPPTLPPIVPPSGDNGFNLPAIPDPSKALNDVTKSINDAGNDISKQLDAKIREQQNLAKNTIDATKNNLSNNINTLIDSGNKTIDNAKNDLTNKANAAINNLPGLPDPSGFTPPPPAFNSPPPSVTVADNTIIGGGKKPADTPPPPSFNSPPPGLPEAPKTIIGGSPPPASMTLTPTPSGSNPPPPAFNDVPRPPASDPLPPVGIGSPPVPPSATPPLPPTSTQTPPSVTPSNPFPSPPPPPVTSKPAIETPPTTIVAPRSTDPSPPPAGNPFGIAPPTSNNLPPVPTSNPAPPLSPPVAAPVANVPTLPGPPADIRPLTANPAPPPGSSFNPPAFTPPRPPETPIVRTDNPDRYLCLGNESFSMLSARKYGNENFARALEEYNRDFPGAAENVRSVPARLTPGTIVWLPSQSHLMQRYGDLVASSGTTPNTNPPPTRPLGSDIGIRPPTPATTSPSSPPVVASNTGVASYRVPSGGMYLSQIAERQLGSPLRWIDIYRLNPGLQPEQPVREGIEIRIPAK